MSYRWSSTRMAAQWFPLQPSSSCTSAEIRMVRLGVQDCRPYPCNAVQLVLTLDRREISIPIPSFSIPIPSSAVPRGASLAVASGVRAVDAALERWSQQRLAGMPNVYSRQYSFCKRVANTHDLELA